MKNIIIFFTFIGALPLYSDFLVDNQTFYLTNEQRQLYSLLVLSFLCGMHWQVMINKKTSSIFLISIPMLLFLWGWSSLFNIYLDTRFILTTGFIFSLIFDYTYNFFKPEKWYLKLRTIVTFLVIIRLFL
tara:strand:- start:137 stop:526 length:390 start_codon:yes stop_codon:yes gene_type:complete